MLHCIQVHSISYVPVEEVIRESSIQVPIVFPYLRYYGRHFRALSPSPGVISMGLEVAAVHIPQKHIILIARGEGDKTLIMRFQRVY